MNPQIPSFMVSLGPDSPTVDIADYLIVLPLEMITQLKLKKNTEFIKTLVLQILGYKDPIPFSVSRNLEARFETDPEDWLETIVGSALTPSAWDAAQAKFIHPAESHILQNS